MYWEKGWCQCISLLCFACPCCWLLLRQCCRSLLRCLHFGCRWGSRARPSRLTSWWRKRCRWEEWSRRPYRLTWSKETASLRWSFLQVVQGKYRFGSISCTIRSCWLRTRSHTRCEWDGWTQWRNQCSWRSFCWSPQLVWRGQNCGYFAKSYWEQSPQWGNATIEGRLAAQLRNKTYHLCNTPQISQDPHLLCCSRMRSRRVTEIPPSVRSISSWSCWSEYEGYYILFLLDVECSLIAFDILDLLLERFKSLVGVFGEYDLVVESCPSCLQPKFFLEVLLFQLDQDLPTFGVFSFFEEDLGELEYLLLPCIDFFEIWIFSLWQLV